ncbi:MAG: hypothetical protein O2854_03040 [Chloroflexi bacterium]|nr:hypothetical protein [Chloroflexota bacterium]
MNNDFPWPLAVMIICTSAAVFAAGAFIIYQAFATWRAKMSIAREEAYKRLAEQSIQAQQRISQEMELVMTELSQVQKQASEMERLLKSVE